MLIRSLPERERPLEKAAQTGIESLSNGELLAVIIHTGVKNCSSLHLAEKVLAVCPDGISGIGYLKMEDLVSISGIGTAKACRILAAIELGKRMATSRSAPGRILDSSDEVANMFMENLRYERKEHFKSVMVNTRGEVISVDDVSIGELSSTVVHPREVFCSAVRKSAAGIIFVHNHPSGDPTPSQEDIRTTERLVKVGELLGIKVLDHVIIGDGIFSSLKSMNLMEE